jgi:hypothetical protein
MDWSFFKKIEKRIKKIDCCNFSLNKFNFKFYTKQIP